MSSCISRFWKAAEQYCVPRSECMIVPATALLPRVRTAILRALRTRSVVIEVSMAQPRMRRLPRSKMVAKNPHPWVVGKYVMSLTHALLSVPGAKSRPKRLKHVVIAVGRFDSTFEMTVPDDAVDTQNASEPLDSDANASLTHERVHLTVPGGVFHLVADDFGLSEHSFIGNDLLALHRHALALNPCVIAADTDLKYLATLGYRDIFEFRILKGSLNKGVPH